MKIRFLQTTSSSIAGYPFQAGQVIEVETLTDEIRGWLAKKNGALPLAEVVSEPEPEAATVAAPERAVQSKAKGRQS